VTEFWDDHNEIIEWCFTEVDRSDSQWADLFGTRDRLAQVLTDIHKQFAAHKAEFEADTERRLDPDEYRRIRVEYSDWKRRASHVQSMVTERLRMVRAEITTNAIERQAVEHRTVGEHIDQIVAISRRLHAVLGEFLDDYDAEVSA
jgi:cell division protein FtsL